MILGPDGKPVDVEPCPYGVEPHSFEKASMRFVSRTLGFDGPRDCVHGQWNCAVCRWMGGYSQERSQAVSRRAKGRIE